MNWPNYQPYYPTLVRLLQGVIYAEEEKHWTLVLRYRGEIEEYFLKIGLLLTIIEHEEFAYLRSVPRDEAPDGFNEIPKLSRSRQLSFPVTVLCVLLKRQYVQHFENVGSFEPPTISADELFEMYQAIAAVARNDEWRGRQQFESHFNKIKGELRLVKESGGEANTWRILPSINSLVTNEFLDQFESLASARITARATEETELD